MPQEVIYFVECHLRSGRTLKSLPLGTVVADGLATKDVALGLYDHIQSDLQDTRERTRYLEMLQCAGQDGLILVNPTEVEYLSVVLASVTPQDAAVAVPDPPTLWVPEAA